MPSTTKGPSFSLALRTDRLGWGIFYFVTRIYTNPSNLKKILSLKSPANTLPDFLNVTSSSHCSKGFIVAHPQGNRRGQKWRKAWWANEGPSFNLTDQHWTFPPLMLGLSLSWVVQYCDVINGLKPQYQRGGATWTGSDNPQILPELSGTSYGTTHTNPKSLSDVMKFATSICLKKPDIWTYS